MTQPSEPRDARKGAVVVLALLLFTLLIRYEVIVDGVIPARGDTLTGFIPHKSFVARTVQNGDDNKGDRDHGSKHRSRKK